MSIISDEHILTITLGMRDKIHREERKAAAEEIFKEMDRLGEIWDVPFVNGKDYNELKKKFGIEEAKKG